MSGLPAVATRAYGAFSDVPGFGQHKCPQSAKFSKSRQLVRSNADAAAAAAIGDPAREGRQPDTGIQGRRLHTIRRRSSE
jgi:hypothetical protein